MILELTTLIEKAHTLVPLPSCAARLASIVGNPSASMDELVQIISFDQVLTLKLLRAANSAASGSALRIATVEDAIARLGAARVASMATAFAVRSAMHQKLPEYDLDEGGLWRHSVASAIAAELIPTVGYVAVAPESFTAALLHDCGKLVVGQFAPPEVLAAIMKGRQEGLAPIKAEQRVLGFDHGEVGAAIAKKWNLPVNIVRAISSHHSPDKVTDSVCDVVCIANAAAKFFAVGCPPADQPDLWPQSCLERIGFSRDDFETLCRRIPLRYAEISKCYEA